MKTAIFITAIAFIVIALVLGSYNKITIAEQMIITILILLWQTTISNGGK